MCTGRELQCGARFTMTYASINQELCNLDSHPTNRSGPVRRKTDPQRGTPEDRSLKFVFTFDRFGAHTERLYLKMISKDEYSNL